MNYDDIINLPHHVSKNHPQMSMHDRAGQFDPFAALTGYASAIEEAGRLTSQKISMGEDGITALNRKLEWLRNQLPQHPQVTITYFEPDKKKEGGSYSLRVGTVKDIDDFAQTIVFSDGQFIAIQDILNIQEKL